jgi:hypothetical protein
MPKTQFGSQMATGTGKVLCLATFCSVMEER